MIGEVSKWVPVNEVRFSNIAFDSSSLTVTVRGVQNEPISVRVSLHAFSFPSTRRYTACCVTQILFYNSQKEANTVVSCTFGESGTLSLSVPSAKCWAP